MGKYVALLACFAVAACSDNDHAVSVEQNALGIARVEISQENRVDERLLTVRGLDDSGQELATATLRVGMVLFSPEPDLMTPQWHPGTELTAAVGQDTIDMVSPAREPHEVPVPISSATLTLLRLHAVSKAMIVEAGLTFPPPPSESELAYSTASCSAANFPTSKASPQQCCVENGSTLWFKIGVSGLLGNRTLGTYACSMLSGSRSCSGTGCDIGPCGGTAGSPTGTSAAEVFHPTSGDSVCGHAPEGSGGSGVPEPYTNQTPWTAPTDSCSYSNCCYQPNNGFSEPELGSICIYVDGESCGSGGDCFSDYCNEYSECASCVDDGYSGCDVVGCCDSASTCQGNQCVAPSCINDGESGCDNVNGPGCCDSGAFCSQGTCLYQD
jgi:hypothetical protein